MGFHVTINIKSAVPAESLAIAVAGALDADVYFNDGAGYVYTLPLDDVSRPTNWITLSLSPRDVLIDGDVGSLAGTALEPYEYELMIEVAHRGASASPNRTRSTAKDIFDKLLALAFPLSLTEDDAFIYADYLPGRGVRNFGSDTSIEVDGRPQWFDPRLYTDVRMPWPSADTPPRTRQARMLVCETRGLVSVIPVAADGSGAVLTPAVAMRMSEVSPAGLGRELHAYIDHFSGPAARKSAGRGFSPERSLGLLAQMLDETVHRFLSHSVCFDVSTEGPTMTVTSCARLVLASDGTLRSEGPEARRDLVFADRLADDPARLGGLIGDLIREARSAV